MQNDSAPDSAAMTRRKHVAVFMARFRTATHAEGFEGRIQYVVGGIPRLEPRCRLATLWEREDNHRLGDRITNNFGALVEGWLLSCVPTSFHLLDFNFHIEISV